MSNEEDISTVDACKPRKKERKKEKSARGLTHNTI
jgi:hypothetical protein